MNASPESAHPPAEVGQPDSVVYDFILFVSGASGPSIRAILSAKKLCARYGSGRENLAIVDVHDDPEAALISGVSVTPTLVKNRPLPARRFVGDPSNTATVVRALNLPSVDPPVDG